MPTIRPSTLLTEGNPKGSKGAAYGYHTAILHLAPSTLAGCGDVCPWASPACRRACLNTAGRGGIMRHGESTNAIQECRKARTRFLMEDRSRFLDTMAGAVQRHVNRARALGLRPAVRPNGTSDIPWESVAPDLFDAFPTVQFYDYTKGEHRLWRQLPSNYHLTYSRSELNEEACPAILQDNGNVAVVFNVLPSTWKGFPVVDGDKHDLRFLDAPGHVVGLLAKGKARKDESGFVVRV